MGLHPDAPACYTNEILVDEYGDYLKQGQSTGIPWSKSWQVSHIGGVHHLVVCRTALLLDLLPKLATWHVIELYLMHAALAGKGRMIHLDQTGYYWRIHNGGIHATISKADRLAACRQAARLVFS